LTDPQQTDN